MAYNFHYTPTGTGVISGKEVLEQTEDAINDLGNTAISGVQEALDKAEQALTNSANAVDDAQTALNTANNAEGVAIQAQNDVSNLSGTVTNIGNRVTTAEGNIGNLQGRMTTAEGNITNLQGRMTTAESNIGNLQTDVSTAQATATSAQQTATTARQQSYVFRYSSTTLVDSSTNSNALLDNTDNLKVGDKVIDSSGVLFSITAIDTANSTFTVGSALIDLALDADVVHTSGNEITVGFKQFDNIRVNNSIKAINLADTATDLDNCYSAFAFLDGSKGGNIQYYYCNTDAGTANISNLPEQKSFFLTSYTIRLVSGALYVKQECVTINSKTFVRYCSNNTWSSWVNETDSEYVHKSGDETIGGQKTFSDNLTIYNSNDTVTPKGLTIKNAQWNMGESGGTTVSNINFLDKNSSIPASVMASKGLYGQSYLRFSVRTKDSQNTTYSEEIYYDIDTSGNVEFRSWHDNIISLGTSAYKWKDVQTYKVNNLEPSSLSLPSGNANDFIDISSYFANTGSGDTNSYTASANGWIYLRLGDISSCQATVYDASNNRMWGQSSTGSVEQMTIPILKGQTLTTQWNTSTTVTVANARFIPCQGNV